MTGIELNHKLELALQTPLRFEDEPLALIATAETVFFKLRIDITEDDDSIVLLMPTDIQTDLSQRTWTWLLTQCQNYYKERNLLK
ncbi:unnamed protein product [marine sediment metagenome]|uniref:Uncharacterized protein n=1 Tax=marine sediment metagenome TaxID=412755 RepID=X1H8K3_9ZZZZ